MKVRKFVTAITAVLCLVLAADIGNTRALKGVPIGAAPVTGNVVLGLAGVTYFGGFYPYLDITKAVGEINITNDATPGVTYSSQVPEGVVDIYGNQSTFGVGRYLDDNGDFLDTLPAGNISANRILWQITGGGPPNYVGQSVTVDWNGGGRKLDGQDHRYGRAFCHRHRDNAADVQLAVRRRPDALAGVWIGR